MEHHRLGAVEKENRAPSKQGVLYELRLSHAAAYLPKDIMHDNPKSIALLAGSHIVSSFASLNATLALTDAKQKEYAQSLSAVDSLAPALRLLQDDIAAAEGQSTRLRMDELHLRQEFAALGQAIGEASGRLVEQYAPLLRGLYKAVKEQASHQKEEVFKIDRQLRDLSDAKRHLLDGILGCDTRIARTETALDAPPSNAP